MKPIEEFSGMKSQDNLLDALEMVDAVRRVEEFLHLSIPAEVWLNVYFYAKRKLSCINKTESYFPILFENELRDYYTRRAINLRGEINRVQPLYEMPV